MPLMITYGLGQESGGDTINNYITIGDLEIEPEIDITIDADEVDVEICQE